MDLRSLISQSMGSAWASGLNLYATCSVLGLLGRFGVIELSGGLAIVESWWVIGPALAMYLAEFVADKIPWFDSAWDAVHTFVRVPLGALLAASAFSEEGTASQVTALVSGGALAAESHALKAGVRMAINASPEPVTNWIASLSEDVLAIGGIMLAVQRPGWFFAFLSLFVVGAAVGLYLAWNGIRALAGRIARMLALRPGPLT